MDAGSSSGGRVAGTVIGILIAVGLIAGAAVLYDRDQLTLDGIKAVFTRRGQSLGGPSQISGPAGAGMRPNRLNTAAVTNASYLGNASAQERVTGSQA